MWTINTWQNHWKNMRNLEEITADREQQREAVTASMAEDSWKELA